MEGDENGIVNVLEPHPIYPVLATSVSRDDLNLFIKLLILGLIFNPLILPKTSFEFLKNGKF